MNILTPKGFLQVGGIVLVAVGILGFFLIGPTPEQSIFGNAWWFDAYENWAHLVIGVIALIAVYGLTDAAMQKWLVGVVGIFALLAGISGFFSPNFLGANMENPLDNILHLAIGIWALTAAYKRTGSTSQAPVI